MNRVIIGVAAILLAIPPAGAEMVPIPRQKPARPAVVLAAAIPLPRPNPRRNRTEPLAVPDKAAELRAPAPSGSCLARLAAIDATFEKLPPINEGGCGTRAPLSVSRIAGVALDPPAIMNCEMTVRLHDWLTADVQPAARKRLKTEVTGIRVGASYVCRRRNNLAGGKLSEHGKANALDMSGFQFAKAGGVTVGEGWGGMLAKVGLSQRGSFMDEIRGGACDHFTTVLGPGSDRYHGDHFHIDAIQRKGGHRICK